MAKTPHNLWKLPKRIPPEDPEGDHLPQSYGRGEKISPAPTSPETSIRIERGTPMTPRLLKRVKKFIGKSPRSDKYETETSDSKRTGKSESITIDFQYQSAEKENPSDSQPKISPNYLLSPMSSTPQPFSTTFTERSKESSMIDTSDSKMSLNGRFAVESFVVDSDQIQKMAFLPVMPERTAKMTSSGRDPKVYRDVLENVYLRRIHEPTMYSSGNSCRCGKVLSSEYYVQKLSEYKGSSCRDALSSSQRDDTPKKPKSECLQGSTNQKRESLQRRSCQEEHNIECDAILIVEGRCFYSFKSVLCSSSTWFQTVLKNSYKNAKSTIELPRMSAEIFDLVHKWMFAKDYRLITRENVVAITQIAFQLRIPELLEFCVNFSKQNKIKLPKKIFITLPYATVPKSSPVRSNDDKNCQLTLEPRCFQQIIRCPEFFLLHINTVTKLLLEDDLNVESEVEVFDAAVAWLTHDWANRVIHASKLLHCIRFACLTNQELISIVYHKKNLAILALPICRDLILQSYLYWSACKSNLLRKLSVPLASVKPRTRLKKKMQCMLGNWEAAVRIQAAWRGYRTRKCLAIQDGAAAVVQGAYRGHLTRLWVKECIAPRVAMQKRHSEQTQAAIKIQRAFRRWKPDFKTTRTIKTVFVQEVPVPSDNQSTMLLIGGYDMSKSFKKPGRPCYLYKSHKQEWELISVTPEPIFYGKAAIIKTDVYVTGGSNIIIINNPSPSLKSAWKWDLITNKWSRIADMNFSRTHHALVEAVDRVFAIGGCDDEQMILNSVEMYEPNSNEWYRMSPMIVNRMAHSAVRCNNSIIVCGGIGLIDKPYGEILNSVEIYYPNIDKWTRGINLRIPRCFSSLIEWKSNLYLVGGISLSTQPKGSISVIDKCENRKSQWFSFIETNLPVHSAAVGIIDSHLCVVGGLCSHIGGTISYGYCYNFETAAKVVDLNVSLPTKLTGMCCVQVPLAVNIKRTQY